MKPVAFLTVLRKFKTRQLILILGSFLIIASAILLAAKQTNAFQQGRTQTINQQQGRARTNRQQNRERIERERERSKKAGEKEEEEDDPDMPPFARGLIEKDEYLNKRQQNINLLRGLPYDRPDR